MKKYIDSNDISAKRVSYILPTKNRAKLLEKTLKSCKKLLKKDDELIVIDGNSSDDTLKVVKKYSKLVDIFLSEPDINHVHATNKGLIYANGKYIKLITDEDIVYPQAMEQAVQIMEQNKNIDVLVGGGKVLWSEEKKQGLNYIPPGISFGNKIEDVFNYGACGMGFIIRKSALAKVGLFPHDVIADVTFLINCIETNCIVKFCRIKLYKAKISKLSFTKVYAKECRDMGNKLLWQHTSLYFYLTYRFKHTLWKYAGYLPPSQTIIKFVVRIWKSIRYQHNIFKNIQTDKRVVWDGGFS